MIDTSHGENTTLNPLLVTSFTEARTRTLYRLSVSIRLKPIITTGIFSKALGNETETVWPLPKQSFAELVQYFDLISPLWPKRKWTYLIKCYG